MSIAHFFGEEIENFAVLANGERRVEIKDAWLYRAAAIAYLQRSAIVQRERMLYLQVCR